MTPLAREIASGASGRYERRRCEPVRCRLALQAALEQLGVRLSIATVIGDDVTGELARLREAGPLRIWRRAVLCLSRSSARTPTSGHFHCAGITNGADIVITGAVRIVRLRSDLLSRV